MQHRGEEMSSGEEKSGGEAKGERAVWTSPAARRAKAELEQWNGVVEAAVSWAQEISLEATFDEFAREHAHVFADAAESKEDEPEHKLGSQRCSGARVEQKQWLDLRHKGRERGRQPAH